MSIQISLNGEAHTLEQAISLAELVQRLELGQKRIAIEYNGMIASRSEYAAIFLKNADKVEIVHAIGGG